MTHNQTRTIRNINDQHEAERFAASQAAREAAALRGELGTDAQLIAMSEVYKQLRSEGRIEEARAVKAAAMKINESRSS